MGVYFRDHPLEDAETLDAQRLQVPFDLLVTTLGNTTADRVGETQSTIEIQKSDRINPASLMVRKYVSTFTKVQ